jgi:hypothetical protein
MTTSQHINVGRLQVIWWPRRCLFRTFVWPDYPELGIVPMFRSVIVWPLEFRWWYRPTRERIEGLERSPDAHPQRQRSHD